MLIESADVPDGTLAQTGAVRLSDRVRLVMSLVLVRKAYRLGHVVFTSCVEWTSTEPRAVGS